MVWDGDERETAVECIFRERRETEIESDSRFSEDTVEPVSPEILSQIALMHFCMLDCQYICT